MKLIAVFMGLLAMCVSSLGEIVPTPGTQAVIPVFERADLVCNCVVESLRVVDEQERERHGKPFLWRRVVATVRINDSYNKEMPSDSQISVAFEEERPITRVMPTLSEGESGLMFLRLAASSSAYEFADKFLGVTRFSSLPVVQGAPGPAKLQSALAGVLYAGRAEDQMHAVHLLQGFDNPNAEALAGLLPLSNSTDPEVALSSLAILLKARTPGAVQRLENYLNAYKGREPLALLSVGTELGRVSDRGDLASLEALASSEHLSIRLGALAGIRNMRSPHSAAVLAGRLDDPDIKVRYLATITLSEIFRKGGDYAPSMYLFDKNPDFYTERWKGWWAEQRQGPSR